MFPIRCFTCGRVLAQYWNEYSERKDLGEDPAEILNDIWAKFYPGQRPRDCCTRMFYSFVDLTEDYNYYKHPHEETYRKKKIQA
jgi:DNA-directed RNA polymerase subunit N